MDSISRESVRNALDDVLKDPNCPLFVAAAVEQIIDCEPSVESELVVYASWETNDRGFPECTNCRHDLDQMWMEFTTPYCPHCGAKMEKF